MNIIVQPLWPWRRVVRLAFPIRLLKVGSLGKRAPRSDSWLTVRSPRSVLDGEIGDEQLTAHALYPPEPLGPRGIESWRARNLVLTTQTATCAVPYNIVTFPPDESQPEWMAYLIAQPEDENVIAIGGHMRIFLDAEARTVHAAEDFSPACLLGRRDPSQSVWASAIHKVRAIRDTCAPEPAPSDCASGRYACRCLRRRR